MTTPTAPTRHDLRGLTDGEVALAQRAATMVLGALRSALAEADVDEHRLGRLEGTLAAFTYVSPDLSAAQVADAVTAAAMGDLRRGIRSGVLDAETGRALSGEVRSARPRIERFVSGRGRTLLI